MHMGLPRSSFKQQGTTVNNRNNLFWGIRIRFFNDKKDKKYYGIRAVSF